jgi:hypothetical protein
VLSCSRLLLVFPPLVAVGVQWKAAPAYLAVEVVLLQSAELAKLLSCSRLLVMIILSPVEVKVCTTTQMKFLDSSRRRISSQLHTSLRKALEAKLYVTISALALALDADCDMRPPGVFANNGPLALSNHCIRR